MTLWKRWFLTSPWIKFLTILYIPLLFLIPYKMATCKWEDGGEEKSCAWKVFLGNMGML